MAFRGSYQQHSLVHSHDNIVVTNMEGSHTTIVRQHWQRLAYLLSGTARVELDGHNLSLADLVAISRTGVAVEFVQSYDAATRIMKSSNALKASLERGESIYGVNTGFGGSADTRTTQAVELQRVLLRELHYGILAPANGQPLSSGTDHIDDRLETGLPCEDWETSTCMPESWTRATIALRVNSLVTGFSGVRPIILQRLIDLLHYHITPRVPIYGSISASGDLSPLSYIGGVLQGKPSLEVFVRDKRDGVRQCTTAQNAMVQSGLEPIRMAAKETLAIVNGTATSCAVAALALHDAHGLAMLSQVLTAMSVEAMLGSKQSFDPVFAQVRAHPGQGESARNLLKLLEGSRLTDRVNSSEAGTLRQDRYSIRTAAQWVGPVLEDLVLAHTQIIVECNSVTDNPIIDQNGKSLHGGNFQAKAVTSAMEKVRQGLEGMGRMMFTQSTELINPATNRGLPPNLVADEPSLSFIMKAVDLQAPALLSELGFLANPVASHVQNAEMGNQALNSLALISARYTHMATNVLSMLAANHVLALCQALDLRAMGDAFLEAAEPGFKALLEEHFDSCHELHSVVWPHLKKQLDDTTTLDSESRFEVVTRTLRLHIIEAHPSPLPLDALSAWVSATSEFLQSSYLTTRDLYLTRGSATHLLGAGSRRVYKFVRNTLRVPFLCTAVLRTPAEEELGMNGFEGLYSRPPTVGTYMTKVHHSIRTGVFFRHIVDLF